jgi:hypothetical protein
MNRSTDIVRRIVVLTAIVGGVACAGPVADDVPPFPFAVTPFPAKVEVASPVRLAVVRAQADRGEAIDLSPAPVPALLGLVVQPQWRGTCVARPGDDVLISLLDGRALLLQRKRVGDTPIHGARPYELCVVRTYFDLTGIAATQPWRERMRGLGLVLGGLADYDVAARVYIRGDAEVVLAAYREPREVEAAARRLGEARLAGSVARIAAKRDELKGKIVVVEAIPYRYPSPFETPVGGRGYFVLRLFEERGMALVPHVDVAAEAVR